MSELLAQPVKEHSLEKAIAFLQESSSRIETLIGKSAEMHNRSFGAIAEDRVGSEKNGMPFTEGKVGDLYVQVARIDKLLDDLEENFRELDNKL